MKLRVHMIITVLLVVGFGILGVSKRSSYTNITAEPDYLNDFYVAEIPTEYAAAECEQLGQSLPDASVVLKVTPVDAPENFFHGCQQKVRVQEIFSGEGLDLGEEIYVTTERWQTDVAAQTADIGFVNVMQEGREYLIFLSGTVESAETGQQEKTKVFRLACEGVLYPIFCYENRGNSIYPTSGESTYVPYAAVSENEFFAAETDGLDAMLALKQAMITRYK